MFALRIAILALALVVPGSFASAAEDHDLEQVLIESASTPAQHQALARHFRARAASARHEAARHRSMTKSFVGGRSAAVAQAQSAHCSKLAESFDAQAVEYDALAAVHEAEARE